ncbi:phosphoglycolate phosphatase [Kineothrix alysoides]|uniref:Phosphoglycolate phosphatase n=1 Tax=Kineothrix alysoides TaxID=1469948 RepID=A0A4R1R4C0_9FIRM|nr:HAD-IA family hydrolase [Kineothrix alysoides]TCL60102.1 phosphoglycolate phosphatase [Kineothrix alysoides]
MLEKKKWDTVVFDLDGTLLNTLEDLKESVNFALNEAGMPLRSMEEIRRFVGNGVMRLMELSVPEGRENPKFERVFETFKEHYSLHCNDKTGLYDHVEELLGELKRGGYKMAIVSNKYYDAVQELKEQYFAEYIHVAIGEKENINRKPAPDTVIEALKMLGSTRETAVYVGDSEVDIATAKNAFMDCISVTWGFRTKEEQQKAGGKLFVDDPLEILDLLQD